MQETIIYCDGSAIGNPGPGGWGAVLLSGKEVIELGASAPHTTNNKMELSAAIKSLEHTSKNEKVILKTDSRYVINGITKWVHGWEKNGWKTAQKEEVLNQELWKELRKITKELKVTFEHVKAHVGIDLNERVDMIANGFARNEKVELFKGSEVEYKKFLSTLPKARVVGKNKGKAYSYISLLEGKITVHKTWAECEKQVKGKKAKFKKVLSKEEEEKLIAEWKG